MPCKADGCEESDIRARGMCNKHYMKWHYRNNKDYYKSKSRRYEDKTRSFVKRVKSFSSCSRCGESRDAALEFHHSGEKEFHISNAPNRGKSIETVKKEIRRCEIICANCHNAEHYG